MRSVSKQIVNKCLASYTYCLLPVLCSWTEWTLDQLLAAAPDCCCQNCRWTLGSLLTTGPLVLCTTSAGNSAPRRGCLPGRRDCRRPTSCRWELPRTRRFWLACAGHRRSSIVLRRCCCSNGWTSIAGRRKRTVCAHPSSLDDPGELH